MSMDERNFCLSVAGHVFSVHTINTNAYRLVRHYLTEDPAETDIYIVQEDIEAERTEAIKQGTNIQDSYLETLAVYRKISEAILDYNVFLMHGAVVAYQDAAYMFTASSGTGKTTHVQKWLENLDGSYIVNGDKPLIKITENEILACGTPWCGKERMQRNCMVPLKAIVLMERGENNEIREVSFGQAFPFLLQQAYMPKDSEKVRKTLALLVQLKGRVRFYNYMFNNKFKLWKIKLHSFYT